jgi:small neutral amino acid transporter SnatA (MarC family)
MAVRGSDRISRHRKRARKRILGAILVFVGIVLWGVSATTHLKPEALTYAGITIGGAAVVGGIILFAITL